MNVRMNTGTTDLCLNSSIGMADVTLDPKKAWGKNRNHSLIPAPGKAITFINRRLAQSREIPLGNNSFKTQHSRISHRKKERKSKKNLLKMSSQSKITNHAHYSLGQ